MPLRVNQEDMAMIHEASQLAAIPPLMAVIMRRTMVRTRHNTIGNTTQLDMATMAATAAAMEDLEIPKERKVLAQRL